MSLYTRIAAGLLFPLHERAKGHSTVALRREMESNQWLSPSGLAQLQLATLREFLIDIGQHVPYYRERFPEWGFDPSQVSSLADLQGLPLMGKPEIRLHTEALKADDARGLARFNTGGSSGEPLIFYIGNKRVSHDVAAKWRATRWWDVDIGDPEIVVWGSPIELGAQDRVRQLRDKLLRTTLIPAFEMSEKNLDSFVAQIRAIAPKMLFGYPSSLALIAAHARRRGQAMDDLGIKVAFVTSEKLYDYQRQEIESVYGCPVANGYGGRDAGFIAHQCPAGNMHLTAEDIIVEIVDAQGCALPPGESGEIVVTHLATRDFPFLRYRTGDVGVLSSEPCSCGRGLPLLAEIQGRTTDFIVAQDGTILHGLALIYVLRDMPAVERFKIIQHSLEHTEVQVLAGADFSAPDAALIRSEFGKRLGAGVNIEIKPVTEIAREKSGKFRYVQSKVELKR